MIIINILQHGVGEWLDIEYVQHQAAMMDDDTTSDEPSSRTKSADDRRRLRRIIEKYRERNIIHI